MTTLDPSQRFDSFLLIDRELLELANTTFEFTESERTAYKDFATKLTSIIDRIEANSEYVEDIEKIIMRLEEVSRNSILEDFVQNPTVISRSFISGTYYFRKREFEVPILVNFIELLKTAKDDKRRIILNNLWQRLDTIKRYEDLSSNLPF